MHVGMSLSFACINGHRMYYCQYFIFTIYIQVRKSLCQVSSPYSQSLSQFVIALSNLECIQTLLDGILVHCRVTPNINFDGTHLYLFFFTITAEIHARSLVKFYCQYADRPMNLKFMRRVSERGRAIRQFDIVKNKLMSVLNVSVLLLTMNFVIILSKQSADPLGYRLVDPQLL